MDTHSIELGAQTIVVRESAGRGPGALLVHGNSSSGRSFQRQLEGPLGERHRLVAIDLPGHGDSPAAADPETAYGPRGYASTVSELADRLGMSDAVFVGWSLGGHILLEASDRLPNAAGLLIFGTPPVGKPAAMERAFLPHPSMRFGFEADLAEEDAEAYAAAFLAPGVQEVPEILRTDVLRSDGRARQVLAASMAAGDYRDEVAVVAALAVPLAVVHGERDQLVNADYIASLSMPTLWRGELQFVPGAGHAPHWERPREFDALLEAFLQDTAG